MVCTPELVLPNARPLRTATRSRAKVCCASQGQEGNILPRKQDVTHLELPGGGFWWLRPRKDEAVVYGDSFTIHRPRIGGEGLVAATKHVSMQKYQDADTQKDAAERLPVLKQYSETGVVLSGITVIDTEFTVLEDEYSKPTLEACTGIVYIGGADLNVTAATDAGAARGHHPRRTRKLRFTCNLCDKTNEKEINPHAWRKGSVFARCDSCSVVHKLRDNLKVCCLRKRIRMAGCFGCCDG